MNNSNSRLLYVELFLILIPPFIPLLLDFPYRINVFLAWDGAYRLSQGHIPFKDFGVPVGYVFWIIPAIFFKIFGPYVFTLIKAQVFINIISNLTLSRLFNLLGLPLHGRIIVLIIYNLSYSLFNFWPWYNHSVFVFELIAIMLITSSIVQEQRNKKYIFKILLASFFSMLSFMTKQDTGFLCIIFLLCLALYGTISKKDYSYIFFTFLGLVISLCILVIPFLQYEFTYWFNYGQYPHNSRISIFDLISEFLGASDWIKFYLLVFVIIIVTEIKKNRNVILSQSFFIFSILTLFILFQASAIQVTSYTPTDGNIYFHSFCIAFFLFTVKGKLNLKDPVILLSAIILSGMWWSGTYWNRFLKAKIRQYIVSESDKSLINKNTYIVPLDTLDEDRSDWRLSQIKTFKKIKLPESTIQGIQKVLKLTKSYGDLKILNMTELTQLSHEIPYAIDKGDQVPLWYHKGVSFFDREVRIYCNQIRNKKFDVILFEVIPDLNNFYPEEIRDCISENYIKSFEFKAPRIPEISRIEVYVKSSEID